MSTWFEPKKEEISLSDDGKELQVRFDSDYSGNIWISLKVQDVKDILKDRKKLKSNLLPPAPEVLKLTIK